VSTSRGSARGRVARLDLMRVARAAAALVLAVDAQGAAQGARMLIKTPTVGSLALKAGGLRPAVSKAVLVVSGGSAAAAAAALGAACSTLLARPLLLLTV
jgi:hypothetical protein